MKGQELTIRCVYPEDGAPLEELVASSFAVFLRREIEEAAPGEAEHG